MRIALLALHFAEYASRLAVALAARHEVLLILRADNARSELTDELRRQVEQAAKVHHLVVRRQRDPRVLFTGAMANRLVREFAPAVLHMQEIHPVLSAGTILSRRHGCPLVLTVHDPVSHSGDPLQDSLRWRTLVWLRRRANRLIVHGPRMRAELEALDRRFTGNVDVIAHGVLGGDHIDCDIAGNEPATFLFFGRMQAYKGLKYFLAAGELLRQRGYPVRLVVAGKGADLEPHRAHIAARPWIELHDRYISAAEVAGLFRRATAAVLPYTDATQSGVAAMALANARPVISTAVGDLPDTVIDGYTGLLVPPCKQEALADAMEELLINSPLRDRLASGARQFAAERLSWPRIAEQSEETYRRAIESRQHCQHAAVRHGTKVPLPGAAADQRSSR